MKKLTTDFHIHTEFSCDSACITYENLISELSKNGITDFGITDHLHWLVQEDDIMRSKQAYDKALLNHPELKGRMHFGVEASVMSEWELHSLNTGVYPKGHIYGVHRLCPTPNPKPALAIDEEFKQKHGIEYVVSGVHWQLYPNHDKQKVINEYFRLYMYSATNPLTDILAHFLWWNKWEKDVDTDPFIDMDVITPSMRSELECALKENDVAFEVADKIEAEHVDLIMCNMITYATSSVFSPIIQNCKAPMILVALQPLSALDYNKASTRMQLENDNICSVPEFIGVANRMNRKIYDVIIGTLYNDAAAV
jgi:histidinol phosphatase-like PHP family hydrolase